MQAKSDSANAANQIAEPERQPATLSALRQAALRLSDAKRKPKLKTRDLVSLLLSHSARAWRCSLPFTNVRLTVCGVDGQRVVKLGTPKY